LKAYVAHFRPDFLGVTGTDDQIQALTGQLGVRYERGASSGPDYAIDHSAAILLIDPEARWRAVLPAPHDPARIAQALLVIRGRS
jgi:protein SCO1/2